MHAYIIISAFLFAKLDPININLASTYVVSFSLVYQPPVEGLFDVV